MKQIKPISRPFADGEYNFLLTWNSAAEFEEANTATLMNIYGEYGRGSVPRIHHVREIVRLGLIGGGMPAPNALRLTRAYVEGRPVIESLDIAMAVLEAFLFGVDDADELEAKEADGVQ